MTERTLELVLRPRTSPADLDRFVDHVIDMVDPDGIVAMHYGITYVTVGKPLSPVENRVSAALGLARAVEAFAECAVDLDLDLVDVTEISDRVGKARETVRLWTTGQRRAGFPQPEAVFPRGVKAWAWADVHEWLNASGISADPQIAHLTRVERALFTWQIEMQRRHGYWRNLNYVTSGRSTSTGSVLVESFGVGEGATRLGVGVGNRMIGVPAFATGNRAAVAG